MTREAFLKNLPELAKNYQPAPEVLKKIKSITLLMVIGPSGVGKTTLINKLGLDFVPSDTTRKPREDERHGIDMYFLTDYQQVASDIHSGRFVQVAIGPGGDFYATRDSSYPDSGTAVLPVVTDVVPIFRHLGFSKTISAFIVPPTYDEWMRRMSSHKLQGEQLDKRLAEAERSLAFARSDKQMHFILNDDVEPAVSQLKGLTGGNIY